METNVCFSKSIARSLVQCCLYYTTSFWASHIVQARGCAGSPVEQLARCNLGVGQFHWPMRNKPRLSNVELDGY